jgi:hypothetical protein
MVAGGDRSIREGEAYGMRSFLSKHLKGVEFSWWDLGNKESLAKARQRFERSRGPNILEKPNEAIWFVNGSVIKFSSDEEFIRNRVERASRLKGFCPPVTASTAHMYRYRKVEGKVLSGVITLPLFDRLLDHAASFWRRDDLNPEEQIAFRQSCHMFYRDKTDQRIRQFYEKFGRADGTEPINGVPMPTLADMLAGLDWNWLSDGIPGRFHGDFHFENILWSEQERMFTFLDWRQEFGGSLTTGDIYYDLAKLLHGSIVSHELISRGGYEIEWNPDEIRFNLLRRQISVECEGRLEAWLVEHGYDVRKVRVLTSLVYLNIAALHHDPYSLLLYALGKYMLQETLAQKWRNIQSMQGKAYRG